jgi:hypothetical protein
MTGFLEIKDYRVTTSNYKHLYIYSGDYSNAMVDYCRHYRAVGYINYGRLR